MSTADTVAARIAERAGAVVDRHGGRNHVHELRLVGRSHEDEAGQAAEIGDVERAGVGRPVGADQTGAVHREAHRQRLDGDVMHHLVVAALQEGRVDRAERLVAFGGQARRKGHGMLLGNADVERAMRERLLEDIDAGARRHRRGHRDDAIVLARFLDEAFAEHLGVGRRIGLRLGLLAGGDVELDDAVILVGRLLGGLVALALLRHDVDQDRPFLGVAHVLEHRQEVIEVVTVDWADVIEAELFEHRAAGQEAAREFLGAQRLRSPAPWAGARANCLPMSRSFEYVPPDSSRDR